MPLGIDHPVWVDEDEIDLDYHIRHQAVPPPGTMEKLRELVAELHAIPLDRSRPLWQYYLIEGLEGGGFAIYIKVHHCDMDGVAGIAMLPFIYDFTSDPPPRRACGSPNRASLTFRHWSAPRLATSCDRACGW